MINFDEIKIACDPKKALRNLEKHGISFDDAELVFRDPHALITADERKDYGEDRWCVTGDALSAILYVVYTVRDGEIIRLISVRKADRKERKLYFKSKPKRQLAEPIS